MFHEDLCRFFDQLRVATSCRIDQSVQRNVRGHECVADVIDDGFAKLRENKIRKFCVDATKPTEEEEEEKIEDLPIILHFLWRRDKNIRWFHLMTMKDIRDEYSPKRSDRFLQGFLR